MIEDIYSVICIYFGALEIPQCFECFRSTLKRDPISEPNPNTCNVYPYAYHSASLSIS